MTRAVVLDAGSLAMITHPRPNPELARWFAQQLRDGAEFVIPEIADYEVRRELIRAAKTKSIERLDQLAASLVYLPLSTEIMRTAARLWADMRRQGTPTASEEALDADVILAAQASSLQGDYAEIIVATDNVGHLARMVSAKRWNEIR